MGVHTKRKWERNYHVSINGNLGKYSVREDMDDEVIKGKRGQKE